MLDYTIDDPRWQELVEENLTFLKTIYAKVIKEHTLDPALIEVSLTFTNDETIQRLNATYRNKDQPTDVLSFQLFDDLESLKIALKNHPHSLGDIVISFETAKKGALHQKKTFKNHLSHLFVHGLLHLLGYDHIEPAEAAVMEDYEIKILSHYNIANPYQIDEE
jgi:probable rRNA maturation factor